MDCLKVRCTCMSHKKSIGTSHLQCRRPLTSILPARVAADDSYSDYWVAPIGSAGCLKCWSKRIKSYKCGAHVNVTDIELTLVSFIPLRLVIAFIIGDASLDWLRVKLITSTSLPYKKRSQSHNAATELVPHTKADSSIFPVLTYVAFFWGVFVRVKWRGEQEEICGHSQY